MLLGNDELEKTKKVADEVIQSVGEVIKRGEISHGAYPATIEAFAKLIATRVEID